jgi:hypothetical protein
VNVAKVHHCLAAVQFSNSQVIELFAESVNSMDKVRHLLISLKDVQYSIAKSSTRPANVDFHSLYQVALRQPPVKSLEVVGRTEERCVGNLQVD